MLKINNYQALPMNFKVDPKSEFEAGQIAQVYFENESNVCGVYSGTGAPLGIIDDVKNSKVDTTISSGQVTVWLFNAPVFSFSTDQFEAKSKITVDDYVFASRNGLFTCQNDQRSLPVGKITGLDGIIVTIKTLSKL